MDMASTLFPFTFTLHDVVERPHIAFCMNSFRNTPVEAAKTCNLMQTRKSRKAMSPICIMGRGDNAQHACTSRPYLPLFGAPLALTDAPVPQAAASTA